MKHALPKLPQPVTCYLEAVESQQEPSCLEKCFAENAILRDQGRDYIGLPEIKSWKQSIDARHRYRLEPLEARVGDGTVLLFAKLKGDFPESPRDLEFEFKLSGEKIVEMAIH